MIAAVFVIGVDRIHVKIDIIYDSKTGCITCPHAEHDKVFELFAGILNFYCLTAYPEIDQILGFREEKIFCGTDGFKRVTYRDAFGPPFEIRFTGCIVDWYIQRFF